jgi:hypothetical protein
MIALKKLVFELDKKLKEKGDLDRASLQLLVDDALVYLKKSKHFEYAGDIKLPGVAFKMVDLNMDLDDIVKELIDKRTDIEFKGEISLTIEEVKGNATKNSAA